MLKRGQFEFRHIVFALALLVLAIQFGQAVFEYARHAQAALTFPYPLDYGEGPLLDQVVRLAHAEDIYRSDLSTPPYTLTTTPPLFRLLQAPFAQQVGPAFWYGRAISIVSIVVAALFIALTVHDLTDNWLAALVSSLTLLAFPHVLQGSMLARADSLALALNWAGLFAIVRYPDQRRGLALSVLLFVTAIYTKPSYGLVAPLTALIWLWQGKRSRQAIRLAGLYIGISVVLFLLLNGVTRGGFSLGIFSGIANEFAFENFLANGIDLVVHTFFMVLGCFAFIVLERTGDPTRSWPLVTPYVLLATLASVTVGKVGSLIATPFEQVAALSLAVGALLALWSKESWLKTAVVLVLAWQISSMVNLSRNEYGQVILNRVKAAPAVEQLAQLIRDAPGPVLADEYMGLLPLNGKQLYFQPVEFALLNLAGQWDARDLIAAIERREFSAILLYEPTGGVGRLIVRRWLPQIREAIYANYERETTIAGALVYLPLDSLNESP